MVNLYVVFKLIQMFDDGRLTGDDAIMIWARAMLWVIPIGIVIVIVLTIAVNIHHAIATGDEKPSFLVDEWDKSISNFGMKVTMVIASIFFIGVMIALAMGLSPLIGFIALYFGYSAGDMGGNLAKMVRYRFG